MFPRDVCETTYRPEAFTQSIQLRAELLHLLVLGAQQRILRDLTGRALFGTILMLTNANDGTSTRLSNSSHISDETGVGDSNLVL